MFGCSKIVSMWLSEGKDQHFLKSKNLLSLSIGWKEKKNLFFKSFGLYFVPYLWKVPDSLEQTGKISVIKLLYFNGDKYSLVFLTTTKKKTKTQTLSVSTSVLRSHLSNCYDPNCEIPVSARCQVSKPQRRFPNDYITLHKASQMSGCPSPHWVTAHDSTRFLMLLTC